MKEKVNMIELLQKIHSEALKVFKNDYNPEQTDEENIKRIRIAPSLYYSLKNELINNA